MFRYESEKYELTQSPSMRRKNCSMANSKSVYLKKKDTAVKDYTFESEKFEIQTVQDYMGLIFQFGTCERLPIDLFGEN